MHFREGGSPENIVESFPTLPLSQAYGATAYYLENQTAVDDTRLKANATSTICSAPESTGPGVLCPLGSGSPADAVETLVTVRFPADEDID